MIVLLLGLEARFVINTRQNTGDRVSTGTASARPKSAATMGLMELQSLSGPVPSAMGLPRTRNSAMVARVFPQKMCNDEVHR